jgi:hypothetical protein
MPRQINTRSILVCRLAVAVLLFVSAHASADGLSAERLTWAGVKLVSDDTTVFIDAVGTDLWDGEAPEGLVPVTADTAVDMH